ncbi:MAG: PorT family protein [Bacteroidales bacterium]|nr:PorT family protein [Bacteroidales bacterium]
MKKISLFIIVAFALSLLPFDTIAQQKALKKGYSTTNWCVSGVSKKGKKSGSSSKVGSSNMFFGIKGGVNLASMSYVGKNDSLYTVNRLLLPFGGIFFEYDNPSGLSIIPTLLYKEDGTGLIGTNQTYYRLVTNNIDFTLPIAYDIYITENFAPFIYIAPDISYNIGYKIGGGTITSDNNDKGSSYYRSFNYGAKAGLGLKYILNLGSLKWLIRLDGAYNFGLSNTLDISEDFDFNYYPITDMWKTEGNHMRKNRGIEVGLSLGIGL